jgi:hypothetical protein
MSNGKGLTGLKDSATKMLSGGFDIIGHEIVIQVAVASRDFLPP